MTTISMTTKKFVAALAIVLMAVFLASARNAKKHKKPKGGNMSTEKMQEVEVHNLTIEVNGKSIYGKLYKTKGRGKRPAVIISHGLNGNSENFVPECTLFAQNGYIAYAYDFCGGSTASKSSGNSTEMTVFTEKDDLLLVYSSICAMDDVDASNVFLLGASQGGLVSSLVAEELGAGKIRGMVLYYPAWCIDDDWRKLYPDPKDIPEVGNFHGIDLGKVYGLAVRDFHVFETIGGYKNPVLIIHGDDDQIVPVSYSQTASTKYENAKLVVLPGEGHGWSQDGGVTARTTALDFLKATTK